MLSIAFNKYGVAPVSDNPLLSRLLRTRSSDTCWSSTEKNALQPVKERFRYVVNVEERLTLVKIDDQNSDILIGDFTFLLQPFSRGLRHPFAPSSPRTCVGIGAAWHGGNDKLHIGSSGRRAALR